MYVQTLDGSWQLSKAGAEKWIPADVPGCVHTDLQRAGVIPDPFYGDNEKRVVWVAETDWTYRRIFEIDEALLAQQKIFLECDGLDTLCVVSLNGNEVGCADNMHRRWRFDVTRQLNKGENTIEIRFSSPVRYVRGLLAQRTDHVLSPNDSMPGGPYLRKAMYQWGWDWAPQLPTMGIWRSIRLTGYSAARITDIHVRQQHGEDNVLLECRIDIERFTSDELSARAKLILPDGRVVNERMDLLTDGCAASAFNFDIENPPLWWPNGYGDQPLCQLDVSVLSRDLDVLDSRRLRIALRKVELRQEPDEWGKSFYFAVNGVPIFAKGADWIPADQFPSRITEAHYRDLVRSAVQANMNMFRVWGGGIYEDDCFYDLCDEYGILIWQDFMFACAHYPVNDDFLQNVRLEAEDNIRRIRHHPCLALWCGNNEMEWFHTERWLGLDDDIRRPEYLKIFYELLPEVCRTEDPDTPYWPASPASCRPFCDPNGEREGDSHYWEVWHGREPFSAYRDHFPRFMSEFGFESLPSVRTCRSFADPDDYNITSYIMEQHQKNDAGNELILYYMAHTFRIPATFPMMVYVSQILQAEAMRYGVEHWRRNRNGYRCMGTTYWQYNDCWPVASWSSVEYDGGWKALQYFARRFYAPVLLSVEETASSARFYLTNDLLEAFEGTVRWSLEKLHGSMLDSGEIDVRVQPQTSMCVAALDFSGILTDDLMREVLLVYELWSSHCRLTLGTTAFVPPKHMRFPEPAVSHKVTEREGEIVVTLISDATARFVQLDVPYHDVRFSDNYFDLPAGRSVETIIVKADGLSVDEISSSLEVISLRDSYL